MSNLLVSENQVLLRPTKETDDVKSGLIILKSGNENLKKSEIVGYGRIEGYFPHKLGSLAYHLKSDILAEIEFEGNKYYIINYKGILASEEK
jgi:co-chaperonin GroES (HSP10)